MADIYQPGQPLRRPLEYGVYPWWPESGTAWIHPHDVPLAEEHIPSDRVLRRSELDQQYSLLEYGEISIRVLATMWLGIRHEGFDVGDMVETRSWLGKNDPYVAVIREMRWNRRERRIEYELSRNGREIHRRFLANDLQHVVELELPANGFTQLREPKTAGPILGIGSWMRE